MSDTRRDQLIDFVEKEFIGPDPIDWPGMIQSNGEEILVTDPPRIRYIAGILYPAETTDSHAEVQEGEIKPVDGIDAGENEDAPERKMSGSNAEFLEQAEELINRSNAYRQSAISLTVAVKNHDNVFVKVTAGTYKCVKVMNPKTGRDDDTYHRSAVKWENNGSSIVLPDAEHRLVKIPVDDTGLLFDVAYRYRSGDSTVYTFTLENALSVNGRGPLDEKCFFQVKFCLKVKSGFTPLADGRKITTDEDYLSNQLLYRNIHNYAIGHGCAANWEDSEPVTWISTAVFPQHDIKPIVPSTIKGVSLEMYKMSPYGNFEETVKELRLMCSEYRN